MPGSLPAHRFDRLSTTLRHSKAQYEYIADSHRASVRPTHSARKRAARLRLAVNVPKAVNCPQKYVSLIPLPLIDDSSPELTSCFSAWSDSDVPSSSSSSSAPMTPSDHEGSPIAICIKRKSMLDEGSDDEAEAMEKRPRYLRKSWSRRI
ncbi:hypothetical protein EDD85DRAFT_14554 [Armillaria nabsnona]|nr:hypothetical protein EDD85DRAFT_14554 [Armillaria nabsnona]